MHAVERSLVEVRRLPGCQRIEFVDRVDPQVHLGRLQAGMAEPEGDLPDVSGGLEGMQSARVALISCKR